MSEEKVNSRIYNYKQATQEADDLYAKYNKHIAVLLERDGSYSLASVTHALYLLTRHEIKVCYTTNNIIDQDVDRQ